MKKKKILALVLAASMAGGMLAGCGSTSSGDETAKGDKSSGKVYYLLSLFHLRLMCFHILQAFRLPLKLQVQVQESFSSS